MIPKSRLIFSDGRIADTPKITSPIAIVFVNLERHIFARDYRNRNTFVEVTGQYLREDELDWLP